jgi:hypothetical protein
LKISLVIVSINFNETTSFQWQMLHIENLFSAI